MLLECYNFALITRLVVLLPLILLLFGSNCQFAAETAYSNNNAFVEASSTSEGFFEAEDEADVALAVQPDWSRPDAVSLEDQIFALDAEEAIDFYLKTDPALDACNKDVCCSPDFIFLIDATEGVGFSQIESKAYVRQFLSELLRRTTKQPCNLVRAAVVEYGASARIKFDFKKYGDVASLKSAFAGYTAGDKLGTGSNALAAFNYARRLATEQFYGHRHNSSLFVFWLVRSTPNAVEQLNEYASASVKPYARIVVIAIGYRVRFSSVKPIATSPGYSFWVNDIAMLPYNARSFRFNYCPPGENQNITTTPAAITCASSTTAATTFSPIKDSTTASSTTTTTTVRDSTTQPVTQPEPTSTTSKQTIKPPKKTTAAATTTAPSPQAEPTTSSLPPPSTLTSTTTPQQGISTTPSSFTTAASTETTTMTKQPSQTSSTTSSKFKSSTTTIVTPPSTTTTKMTTTKTKRPPKSTTTTATRPVPEPTSGTTTPKNNQSTVTMTTTKPIDSYPDASLFCFQCRSRRNHKDLYADLEECHHYYQCLYINETYAIGIRRVCPVGSFWHDAVLQCMPEGSVPCVDLCLDDSVSARGCYPGNGCRQFFVCANTASYGMCCPHGSRFNASTCGCDDDEMCQGECSQQGPLIQTTILPPSKYNETICRDSWGTYISTVLGESNAYVLINEDGVRTIKQYCPFGVSFNIETCRCSTAGGPLVPRSLVELRRALLWVPFDDDMNDHSVNQFPLFPYDEITRDTSIFAIGGGSLALVAGHISIPGLKTVDMRSSGSWCAFFRCADDSYTCAHNAGILSNNKDMMASEYTVILASQSSNRFTARLHFWHPVEAQSVNSQLIGTPPDGWNHVCVTYDGMAIRLFVNGAMADIEYVGGALSVAHCPYVIGTDQVFGNFNGHIDDVLITPFAMTRQEIDAHRNGERAYLIARGFW